MSAYNETNFNKLLDEYSEMKEELYRAFTVINNLVEHIADKYNYSEEQIAKVVLGKPLEEVITIQP